MKQGSSIVRCLRVCASKGARLLTLFHGRCPGYGETARPTTDVGQEVKKETANSHVSHEGWTRLADSRVDDGKDIKSRLSNNRVDTGKNLSSDDGEDIQYDSAEQEPS